MNQPKRPVTPSANAKKNVPPAKQDPHPDERDYHLNRRDAAAGAPADASVTGEEDPGAGLEFLVKK
jgi:hypothetical protein